jgi:hypothetical protein
VSRDTLRFAATGLDGVERSTSISCPGAVAHQDGRLRVPLALQPGGEVSLEIKFELAQQRDEQPRSVTVNEPDSGASMSRAGAEADAWLANHCRLDVDEELVDRILRRSLLDLRLLASDLGGHRFYAAGVPWYATLFGRDSIIAALQTLAFDPGMAEETLRVLAARLGTRVDDEHDEEPGKVLHELRDDELAAVGLTPLSRYYGTVDATPLFLCLLCEHANWTAITCSSTAADHPAASRITVGRTRGTAFPTSTACRSRRRSLSSRPRVTPSPPSAGWLVCSSSAATPIVLRACEPTRPGSPRSSSGSGCPTVAFTPSPSMPRSARAGCWPPIRGTSSGHLRSGLSALALSAARLMGHMSYSGWRVRTLSSDERAFNPVGYHTGTVWPHDNCMFALGLRNYGFDQAFLRIFEDLLEAASVLPDYRLPELIAGFSRADYEDPVPYPVACSPQAWAAGSLPAMLIAGLGITPDGLQRTLRIRRPSLPRQVNRVALEGLRVGDATVDLAFERVAHRSDSVALTDVKVDGQLDVVLEILRSPEREQQSQVAPRTMSPSSEPAATLIAG